MLDRQRSRKILGGPAMTHLMIAGGVCLLLIALILVFNFGAHRH